MIFQKSLLGPNLRAALSRRISGVYGSVGADQSFHPLRQTSYSSHTLSGLIKNFKVERHLESSVSGNPGVSPGFVTASGNASLPHALTFRNGIHSEKPTEVENEAKSGYMDYVRELLQDSGNAAIRGRRMDYAGLQENGNWMSGRRQLYQPQLETNADIVHIKLMRNNTFVTVTDSKGNRKFVTSAGIVAGKGGKVGRYAGEAAAEEIGRKVRQMKIKSVVVKVSGHTFFRRKKDAILGFKDGYTNSRGDTNPIVYIEDTTRKPHNGCRLPKKRRI